MYFSKFPRFSSLHERQQGSGSNKGRKYNRISEIRQMYFQTLQPQVCPLTIIWWPFFKVGLAKKFFWFLSKNKRHIFHFHQELHWTTYSPFCSTTFCHFSGNFIIPSSQNFIFLSKELFQVPFTVLQGIEIFFH